MSHEQNYNRQQQQNYQQKQPQSHQMVKAGTAAIVGGSLLVLSGLILAGNVIFLTLSTPLLVIFSPVLVPAAFTIFLLGSGFLASGGFGVAAVSGLSWIYRYVTGKHPPGADQLDHAKAKLSTMVREMKDIAKRYYNREKQQHYQTQQQHYYQQQEHQHFQTQQPGSHDSHQMVKAATAATGGGSLLVLSGLTLAGTVVALTLAAPLAVVFSPVLVPAVFTIFSLGLGFLASGGFGVATISVLSWIYRYFTGKHPAGADQLDHTKAKLSTKAGEMKDMAEEYYNRQQQQQQQHYQSQQLQHYETQQQPRFHQMVKAAAASIAGGSLLVLSSLTLAGTVVALTLATPLLVIFSPVLVPAVFTISFLGSGFLASGGFGVASISVLSWTYRYVTGKHPSGADQLDNTKTKLGSKAWEMKDKAEQFGQHNIIGSQAS